MANKNILMQKKNGSAWDVLYPITMATNVFDSNGISINVKLRGVTNVTAASNVFVLDLATNRNFTLEILDSNPKTITFTNIPTDLTFVETIQIKLICTNVGTITFPTGTKWLQNVIPDFLVGQTYYLSFTRTSGGWHVYAMGGF